MSELTPPLRRRRRRVEAERSIAAVLDAAVRVLAERPHGTVEEIASVAGVTRQTVYAHFPTRTALLNAVIDRITADTVAAMDAACLDDGPAIDALLRFLDAAWRTFDRYRLLLQVASTSADQQRDRDRHEPVIDRLERLIRRGQDAGEFGRTLSPSWLIAATVALGHTAGAEVHADRLTATEATTALRDSILRLYGVDDLPTQAV